jgi:tRNA threonylcarbamoyladenosine biosynthesis protein TsaE
MSTNPTKIIEFEASTLKNTILFAQKLGELLKPGDSLALMGTLGAGKTHFAKGIALGLGVNPDVYVTSPTFTIINSYEGNFDFYHLDLYRLDSPEELTEIGYYEIIKSESVVAIEWWDNFPEEILPQTLHVKIDITEEESRTITLLSQSPEVWNQKLKSLKS